MHILFCGGAGEVGASCFLLQADDKNILLDCGIRMAGGKDALPDFRIIQEAGGVDAIFISHAHLDHTGSLPIISREYPEAPIYMTHATKDLVRVLLYDSLKIMSRQEGEIPIYAEKHVIDMLDRIVCFSPEHPIVPFDDRDIEIIFYSAGHILGASGIYIKSTEGSVFYSGDISMTNQHTVPGAAVPKLRPDVMLIESTYGDKLHANRQIEERRLVEMVDEVISRGGKILIPAFALGRAQEIILILRRAKNKGELKGIKVYVDGMVKDICRVYRLNPNYIKPSLAKRVWRGNDIFFDDDIVEVENADMRGEIVEDETPCCIISSSGMLSGGPSQWYASKLAPDPNNHIAITGYQDEEAPGRALLALLDSEEEKSLKLGDVKVPVRCSVASYSLSAHADRGELLGLVHSLSPRKLFLVHGEEEATFNLGREIQEEIWGQVYIASNGEEHDVSISRPRKQIRRWHLPSLNKSGMPTDDDMELLWGHIRENGGENFAISSEEMLRLWRGDGEYSQDDLQELMGRLNTSKFFEPDRRRPFLFRLVPEYELEEEDGPMEVNQMLKLAEQFFPPETGLYKRGARFDEGVALLYFSFPPMAEKRYRDKLAEFEDTTGWTVELNDEYNLEAVENAIYRVLPTGKYMEDSMSFYRDEGLVRIVVEGLTDTEKQHIVEEFKALTGLELSIDDSSTEVPSPPPVAQLGQMEQNRAFAIIEDAFSKTRHRLYKKSLKRDAEQSFIELSFITPEVGMQYSDLIEELEADTGWSIRINPNANLNQIIKLVRRLLEMRGLYIKKNPSIHQDLARIKVVPANDWDKTVFEEVSKELFEATCYELII